MAMTTVINGEGKGGNGGKGKSQPPKKPLKNKIPELEGHDEKSWRLYSGSGLLVKPGSLFKVHNSAYKHWGVGLTHENKAWIKKEAEKYYEKDLQERDQKSIDIGSLTIQPFSHYMSAATQTVGKIVKQIIKTLQEKFEKEEEKKKKENMIKICVLGPRNGGLVVPIISNIRNLDARLLEKIEFYLVEPSVKIENARNILPTYGVNEIEKMNDSGFSIENKIDERFLSTQEDEKFDLMISLFHLHCKPFPDHLVEMYRVMKEDAALVIADNYSPLWYHPAFVHELLSDMKAGENVLDGFKKYFDFRCADRPPLTELEQGALRDHKRHMLKIVEELRNGPDTEKPVFVFRAHKTVEAGIKELCDVGFTLRAERRSEVYPDIEKIPGIKLPYHIIDDSEYITLLVALKG